MTDISNLKWSDEQWLQKRKKWDQKENPLAIYEVHMAPGCVIRAQRMRDFIPIVNLLIRLQIM